MLLPVEITEVDDEGKPIFFKSQADISKSQIFDDYHLGTHDRVNELYNKNHLPLAKFRGFVYNYSTFLSLCSRNELGQLRCKLKVQYKAIRATYQCEQDPRVVFIVMACASRQTRIRVLRLPTPLLGTTFRYVVDQLQLSPVYRSGHFTSGNSRITLNSGSSFSTPMAEESDESVTSASHYFYRSAAHNPTMRAFYRKEEGEEEAEEEEVVVEEEWEEAEPKLPRVPPLPLYSMPGANWYPMRRQKSDIFDNFDPSNYEIYRPVSRKSRADRSALNHGGALRPSTRRVSRQRLNGSEFPHGARGTVRNKSLVCKGYGRCQCQRGMPQSLARGRTSRSGSLTRRIAY